MILGHLKIGERQMTSARPYIEVHISTGRRSKVSVHCSSGPAAFVTGCSANGSSSHGQGQRDAMLKKSKRLEEGKIYFDLISLPMPIHLRISFVDAFPKTIGKHIIACFLACLLFNLCFEMNLATRLKILN